MKPQKSAAKLSQGRVMYADTDDLQPYMKGCSVSFWTNKSSRNDQTPVLVLPCQSADKAKRRSRIETMEREKLVDVVARAMWQVWRDTAPKDIAFRAMKWTQLPQWGRDKYRMQARATISVFHGDAKA